jgi:hypothetical protein
MSASMPMKAISACGSGLRETCAHPAEITKLSARTTLIDVCINDVGIRLLAKPNRLMGSL